MSSVNRSIQTRSDDEEMKKQGVAEAETGSSKQKAGD
jgi:hypothetical protein